MCLSGALHYRNFQETLWSTGREEKFEGQLLTKGTGGPGGPVQSRPTSAENLGPGGASDKAYWRPNGRHSSRGLRI